MSGCSSEFNIARGYYVNLEANILSASFSRMALVLSFCNANVSTSITAIGEEAQEG